MTSLDPRALAEIVARPMDDAPRLALAATLRAGGDPRGAFIEAQLRLAQRGLGRADRAALQRESERLLAEHGTGWQAAAAGLRAVRMRRGFVDDVVASAQELTSRGAELFAHEPITRLTVTEASADMLAPLAKVGAFDHVVRLTVRGMLGADGARVLAEALVKRAAPLASLNVGGTSIEAAGIATLAGAIKGCRSLALTSNPLGDEGLEAIAKSKTLSALDTLFLTDTDATDEGITALAKSANLAMLARLGVARNEELSADGLRALAKSKKLKRLRWLEYSDENGYQQVATRGERRSTLQ